MAKKRRKRSYTQIKSGIGPVVRFKFKIVFVIFIIILVICFVIYMTGVNFDGESNGSYTATWNENSDESSELDTQILEISDSSDEADNNSSSEQGEITNPVPESAAMSQTYFGKCVFVGDSITVGLSDYQFVPMKNVLAEIGMNIEKINSEKIQTAYGETTVLDALTQSNAENIYIMLGSNGIAWLEIEDMVAEYSKFTDSIKQELPDVNIYILSIPPVTAEKEYSSEPISNESINNYNAELLKMADKKGYYFVDTHSAIKNADGVLSAEDAAEDGMHFNNATYDKMVKYILSHVAK